VDTDSGPALTSVVGEVWTWRVVGFEARDLYIEVELFHGSNYDLNSINGFSEVQVPTTFDVVIAPHGFPVDPSEAVSTLQHWKTCLTPSTGSDSGHFLSKRGGKTLVGGLPDDYCGR